MDEVSEFREYLDKTGTVQALTDVLIKLFETEEKPENTLTFILENLGGSSYQSELSQLKDDIRRLEDKISKLESQQQQTINIAGDTENASDILERFYALRNDEQCQSLLKKHLTNDLVNEYIDVKTEIFNSSLFDCIKLGLNDHNDPIGIKATDADCYTAFFRIFNPIICEVNQNLPANFEHPKTDWRSSGLFGNPDPKGDLIESCSIFCSRSMESFPFSPKMDENHFIMVLNLVRDALDKNKIKEFQGKFYALETMDSDTKARLIGENVLFDNSYDSVDATNEFKFWPKGRAIFISNDKRSVAHINHKNHLRFGCLQKNSDLKKLYEQMIEFRRLFDENLSLVRHSKYGWITTCPSLLGNTLEISVKIRLRNLARNIDLLNNQIDRNFFKITNLVNLSDYSVILEIQNCLRLGITEFETMKLFIEGLSNIIKAETDFPNYIDSNISCH